MESRLVKIVDSVLSIRIRSTFFIFLILLIDDLFSVNHSFKRTAIGLETVDTVVDGADFFDFVGANVIVSYIF